MTKIYTTGSFDRYGESHGYVLELALTEKSTDTVANTSVVAYKLQLCSGSGNRFDWELTSRLSLNGKQVAAKTEEKYLDYNSCWVLLEGTATVAHDEDGTLDMAFSATVTPWNGGNSHTPPKLTVAGSMALTDIPRASAIAATGAYIGQSATIAVARKSTQFTHSIAYRFGSLSGYLGDSAGSHSDTEQKLSATTIVFPIPESFYGQIPDKASDTCYLTCTTYAGTEVIGTATAAFSVTADPASCSPRITAQAEDICQQTLELTGNSHAVVALKSRIRCSVQAEACHGATITGLFVNGVQTDGTVILEAPVSADITVRAEDSRGYSAQYTVPGLTLVPYVAVSAHAAASRTDPTGGSGRLTLSGKWFAGTFGAVENALHGAYRVDGGDWISFVPATDGGDMFADVALSDLDYRYSHTIDVQLADRLETVTKTAALSKGIPVFDWGENDVCFHVPVIFTATDGSRFSIDLAEGSLQIRRQV